MLVLGAKEAPSNPNIDDPRSHFDLRADKSANVTVDPHKTDSLKAPAGAGLDDASVTTPTIPPNLKKFTPPFDTIHLPHDARVDTS